MLRVSLRTFSKKSAGGSGSKIHFQKCGHNDRIFTLDANSGHSNGTVMLVGWLYSTPKVLAAYGRIYHEKGLDVVACTPTWTHVLYPDRARKLMADVEAEMVRRNVRNTRQVTMVSSFSMGAYMTSLWLKQARIADNAAATGPSGIQQPSQLQMVRGWCFDSPVDADDVPRGIGRATFMKNPAAAKALQRAIELALKYIIPGARKEHLEASSYIINHPIGTGPGEAPCPSLWMYSDADAISTPELITRVTDLWSAKFRQTVVEVDLDDDQQEGLTTKVMFQKTPHVSHMRDHPKMYTDALNNFLDKFVLTEKKKRSPSPTPEGKVKK